MERFPEELKALTAWNLLATGESAARIASPFTFGDDGACITFTVCADGGRFSLRDHADHFLLAAARGVNLEKDRIRKLNDTAGVHLAAFDDSGEIHAEGEMAELQNALFDAAKLALSLSFHYEKWLPRLNALRYRAKLGHALAAAIPAERILKDHVVTGISGHAIKFPFTLRKDNGALAYIEAIAIENSKIDWPLVYQAHGKFSDIKRNDDPNRRLTFIEDGAADFDAASTLLASVSAVRTLATSGDLAGLLAA